MCFYPLSFIKYHLESYHTPFLSANSRKFAAISIFLQKNTETIKNVFGLLF